VSHPSSPLPPLRRFLQLLLCGGLLALPLAVRAQESGAKDPEPPSLAEKTSTAFQNLQPLLNAKNWTGVLNILDGLLAQVDPNSYDNLVIQDMLWKIYWQGLEKPDLAVPALEKVIQLGQIHPEYLSAKDKIDKLQFAGQLYYVQAIAIKNDPAAQRVLYDKSMGYMKRWLDANPHPKSDEVYLYSVLLYQKSVVDPDHIDQAVLRNAMAQTNRALRLEVHPRDSLIQLLAVENQQSGDLLGASICLEQLVKLKPMNKDYWAQLMALYINLAGGDKDPEHMREFYACAINTIERAQALGFLKSQKDNYNLVTMYDQVGQFGKATELLYKGLKNHGIDSTLSNWLVLAFFYQQVGENLQAITVLKDAEERFPASGDIDRSIADIYYADDNTKMVYEYCKKAIEKGHLVQQKPYTTYQLEGFSAYELGKYQEALEAIEKAISYPGSPKDLKVFRKGIQDAIKREAATKEAIDKSSQ
jgi:tetratricopeptide (TPR) repeat protein